MQGLLLACACVCTQETSKAAPESPVIRVQAVEEESLAPQVVATPGEIAPEDERTDALPPDRAERMLQLEELLKSLSPQPQHVTFAAEEATPLKAIEVMGIDMRTRVGVQCGER